jgi:HTH-type transcriptional regulator / antitoxin HipB
MIQNEHQYKVTQNKLKDLEPTLVELLEIENILHPRQFSSRQKGLQLKINNLSQEIEEYNNLKQQTSIKIASISDRLKKENQINGIKALV